MMKVFDNFYKLAHKLITKNGYVGAKLIKQIPVKNSPYNQFVETIHNVDIVILPLEKYSRETVRLVGEKNLIDSNYSGFMPFYGIKPSVNDVIKTKDNNFVILSVTEINPNGESLLFQLELK